MYKVSSGIKRLRYLMAIFLIMGIFSGCKRPDEDIVLRQIRDVVVDATTEPMLKANAIFYNPNNMRGRLKKIDIEIFVNGKKSASSPASPAAAARPPACSRCC